MCEIFVKKNIKVSSDRTGIIKSKWMENTLVLRLFVQDEANDNWNLYSGNCDKEDILKQCRSLGTQYEEIKGYLTEQTSSEEIYYEIENNKFMIYKNENIDSEDVDAAFAHIIYFKISLTHETLPKECINILMEQLDDLEESTKKLISCNAINNKFTVELQMMVERYEKLASERLTFEQEYKNNVVLLLNAKKKFIQDNICNVTKLNLSAGDDPMLPKKDEKIMLPSESITPSKKHSIFQKGTPTRSPNKRTPSKRLQKVQQLPSDSDDSFSIIQYGSPKKLQKKCSSESLDSSLIFKNFKVKTSIKQKEEKKRESSVELKIEKYVSAQKYDTNESESGSSKSDGKSFSYQNAQKIDEPSSETTIKNEDSMDIDEIPCSQEIEANFSSSFFERKTRSNKSKQRKTKNSSEIDPYNVDTVNILNSDN